jgi:flagellar motor switch protein FliM
MAASSLEACFESVSQVTFRFDRLETSVEFTILGPNDMPVVAAQILFQVLDHGGRMFILIPQAALYPIRKKLAREHQPVSQSNDPRWMQRMQRGISQTDVTLQAVLETRTMTLGEIRELKVGQLVPLRAHTQDLIAIQSGGEQLFAAKLGQGNGRFLCVIETVNSAKDSIIDNLMKSLGKS